MFIVTGGAGFIGSNLVKELNNQGIKDILIVDDLKQGKKIHNIADCDFSDYQHKTEFLQDIMASKFQASEIKAIFHQGACSATTEWDGEYMMKNNYEYSKVLLHYCMEHKIPFIYASSAATYGNQDSFVEERKFEEPVNVYGFSKFQFDQYVRNVLPYATSQIVGFRYFNVYGPREQHKGSMASVAFHHYRQMLTSDKIKLFGAYDGYAQGEQKRDFVFVEDVIATNLWFLNNPEHSGIFNLGTGTAEPFNNIAKAALKWFGTGEIEYIPFPDHLKGHYQSYTQANLDKLRATGCDIKFKSVSDGVKKYFDWLRVQS